MAIDPNIALGFKIPEQPNVLQSVGSLMSIKNAQAEYEVRQAQAEQERQHAADLRAQADQRNRDLGDQNTVQQILGDPAAAPKLMSGDFSPIQGKVQPKTLDALRVAQDAHQKALLANTKETNEIASTNLGKIVDTINGLKDLGDPAAIAAAYPTALNSLRAQNAFEHLPNAQPPESFNGDPKQLDQFLAGIGGLKAATDKALATQKERQGILESEAKTASEQSTAALNTAKLPGEAADAQIKQQKADLMKSAIEQFNSDPNKGASIIDDAIPENLDATANHAYKAAYHAAMAGGDLEKAAQVVAEAAGKAAELSPAKQANTVATHVREAQATAPIEQARAIATASANRAQTGADKLDADYNAALSTVKSIGSVLDLAEGGNKAAGANVPLVGVGALNAVNGIKRINSAEIAQYGTAGSLVDKIKGKLQGWTEGQPIPKDVLEDMRTLHDQLAADSYDKYVSGLKALETRTKVSLPPTLPPPPARATATKSGGSTSSLDDLLKKHGY